MKKILFLFSVLLLLFVNSSAYCQNDTEPPVKEYKTLLKGRVTSFGISPSHPEIIYACSRDRGIENVFKSVDSGNSWKKVKGLRSFDTISIDSEDPNIVYASPGG